jgi:hypothetical protein
MKHLPLIAALLVGCTGSLPQPQIVITPRVLAIVADPPEAAPGTDIDLHVVAFDPEGRTLSYRWTLCITIADLLSSANIPIELPEDRCVDLPSTTADAVVPGIATQAVVDQLMMAAEVGGFDVSFLLAVLDTAGFSFEVDVEVIDEATGEVLLTAYKRVAITRRASPTTNPPVIDYLVGETAVSMPIEGWTGSGDECVVWGEPIVVAPEAEVVIAPQGDPEEWIETFPIIGYDGSVTEGRENAYYSFYATRGELSTETTRLPDRDATFTAPEEPGPVRLWLVVRDGHLGTRACTFELTVE